MKQNFLEYSQEQLIEEKSFRSWALRGENKSEWERFFASNSDFYSRALKAKEIVLLLQDEYDSLGDESVLEIWRSIDKYEQGYKQKVRKLKNRRRLSWAASVLIIVSLGTFSFFYLSDKDKKYEFVSSSEYSKNEARMIFPSGEKVFLKRNNSIIAFNDINARILVNDSIIQMDETSNVKARTIKMNEVVIPFGKKSELLLADGTKVWLNAGSRLAFPSRFTKKNREVYLEGEACFQVSKNEEHPFIVKTGDVDIRVLGTHFNVSVYPGDAKIETVLLEGSVVLNKPNAFGIEKNGIVLKPNQKASFEKGQNEFIVTDEPDVDLYVSWIYGWLQYRRESLISVLKKVERYYNVQIQYPASYPVDDKISGKLDLKNSLDKVMRALADAADFNFRIVENRIIIEKKMEKMHRR